MAGWGGRAPPRQPHFLTRAGSGCWRRGGAPRGWAVKRAGRRPGMPEAREEAAALRRLVSAVSTRPTRPRSPACCCPGRSSVDAGARTESSGSLGGGSLHGRALRGIPFQCGRLRTSPPESASVSGKAAVFSERFELSFENEATRDRWFWCLIFIALFC